MAKEFKNFDRMFSKAEIDACRMRYLRNGASASDIASYKVWPFACDQWSSAAIRENVYFTEGSHNWQLFRVSMKGCSTQEKLYMLHNFWVTNDARNNEREKCRIDNYLGALRRGGQLDSEYRVVK